MIYLDYNATSPTKPAVRTAVMEAMERVGNSSSVHRYGRIARRHMEEARAGVGAFVGVKPAQVIFTSGGTEANAMVLNSFPERARFVSSIEHASVLAHTSPNLRLPVTAEGVVDVAKAEEILEGAEAGALISVMLVNNETGVIQPLGEIARLARRYGHFVHTDAVQAAGRLPIDFADLNVDFLSISAHKLGGPSGIGALIIKERTAFTPMLIGGGQEMNRRAGTENSGGIAGFGVAVRLAADDLRDMPRLAVWRDRLQTELTLIGGDDAIVLGAGAHRVANTLCLAMRGISSETQLMAIDLAGVAVSAGSACSSGKVKISHVLDAMGADVDVKGSAIRISLGWKTVEADILRMIEAWTELFERTQKQRRLAA